MTQRLRVDLARRALTGPQDELALGGVVSSMNMETASSELVRSYESRFDEAIAEGESIYGEMTPLMHAAHDRRMAILASLDLSDLSDAICVDFGCGSWGFAAVFPALWTCGYAIGIDVSLVAIQESARLSQTASYPYGKNFTYLTSRGDNIPLRDESVDLLFAGECIEHIENTDAFLEEVYRVLRPEGAFILTTPNADGYLYRIRGERYCVGPEHVALMGYRELQQYLADRFVTVAEHGFNGSLLPDLDVMVRDSEFAKGWVEAAVGVEAAASLVIHCRKRGDYQRRSYRQDEFEADDPRIDYRGEWREATLHESMTARLALSTRESLKLRFVGTDLVVLFWSNPWSGHAVVVVDDDETVVDLFSSESGFFRLHLRELGSGEHTVEIGLSGTRDERSQDCQVFFHKCIAFSATPVGSDAD